MKRDLAVVLVSGGLDSCVTAAIADQAYDMAFLHVQYGQRTEERELLAFQSIADSYHVSKRLVTSIEHLKKIGGSSLVDTSMEIPKGDADRREIPATYVPFRNAHLISIAVSWGEVINARKIFIGAVYEDSSGYPDCRREYYDIFNQLIEVGTRPETDIEIETPIIGLKKSHIVKKGIELKAPLEFTWSCYQNSEKACGICDSCVLRLRGFEEAGIKDPIEYEINE